MKRRPSRTLGLWLDDLRGALARGIRMLLRLLVTAKTIAHRRQDLFVEGVLLARTKAREQRRGQHFGGHGFVDGGVDGPAPLAGIIDVAGIALQRGIFGERGSREIE